MPANTDFTNILPDPNNMYNDAGQDSGTIGGPGFASVKLLSKSQTAKSRTNSGRLVTRQFGKHNWEIDIKYNPMTREEFEPVYSFLLSKQGQLVPFFVSLPQYRFPRDINFKNNANVNNFTLVDNLDPGLTNMLITHANYDSTNATHGSPKPGDLFTINNNTVHDKTYQVTKVEKTGENQTSAGISDNRLRVHFTPPLSRETNTIYGITSTKITFSNPLIRVIMKSDIQEYSLGSTGLYEFSLKLEEALR